MWREKLFSNKKSPSGAKAENASDSAISSPPENASKSLQDVMSEQLAEKLVKDQSNQSQRKELERQLSENGFDQDEIEKAIQMSLSLSDSTEKRDTESSVGKQESNTNFLISEIKDQFVEPKPENQEKEAAEEDLDVSNDALLAKLLQKQLDQEYNEELQRRQNKLNTKGKINVSYDNYKLDLSSDDSYEFASDEEIFLPGLMDNRTPNSKKTTITIPGRSRRKRKSSSMSNNGELPLAPDPVQTVQQEFNSEDDACPEIYEDLNRPKKLTGREERYDPDRDEWINKHDIIEGNRSNALKLDSFPLQCKTGNMKDLSLSNKIYNSLKSHAYDQKRQQARLHEDKEKSTAEHAVDKRTRLILHKIVNAGTLEEINGVISIGKEAVVLHAKGGKETPLNQNTIQKPIPENVAIKVFKSVTSEFKNREQYIADDYRFESRFKKVNSKKFSNLWAEKEMRNLERLHRVGIACPEVVLLRKHILMMRFIGSTTETGGSDASAAPKLSDYLCRSEVKLPTQVRAFQQTVEIMKKMYTEARLVHADLSAYNLLWHENKVWVIDTAQAVEPQHPKALEFLYRDCLNICKFFGGKLKIREVPNPKSLFYQVCDIDLEGITVDDSCSYQDFDPSSPENLEFFGKLEELQLRAKKRTAARKNKGGQYIELDDGTLQLIDDV